VAAPPAHVADSSSLTVYAAASLQGAMRDVSHAYEQSHPGVVLSVSTDASSALEVKIEQGAAADVFLSADMATPQKLVDYGLATGPVTRFAANRLTIIVPVSNPAGIRSPADLAMKGVKVIAAGSSVPVTTYAHQVLANLARLPEYPAGYVARCLANVVSAEDNVAAVVAKVALGEGDAAIVYATDAKATAGVAQIPIPTVANVRATYGGVVVTSSRNAAAAQSFLAWLAGRPGQAILASHGYLPPS
jgi:molybdate transport system substrate-binding protein